MEKGLMAYMEVLRLVCQLPADTRMYYDKYARESFVNYRELEAPIRKKKVALLSYLHYAVDVSAADGLKIEDMLLRMKYHAITVIREAGITSHLEGSRPGAGIHPRANFI
ncbi:LYR motif-containing protein [Platanthera guangdongensis]|uniref:LYR motif-containing protein n=1 Tax=Platanthera guangdongensis TaxID=2320717 RepID=A0ABR2MLA3_9ASPA